MSTVRPPAVAGKFYPANPAELQADVSQFIDAAPASDAPPPKALIAPHAGFVYSGPIAGSAFARLNASRGTVSRVVHLGPAHFVRVEKLAAPSADAFETPLGRIPVDSDTLDALLQLPQVEVNNAAHHDEHCLEVQLPFLQLALGNSFSLVPLLVGNASPEDVSEVIEQLWGGEETLFVVSSDLSHYLDYKSATSIDRRTSRAIEDLDPHAIASDQACGQRPIQGLLLSAKKHHLTAHVLDLRNSGDTAGPHDRVVGYGAYDFR